MLKKTIFVWVFMTIICSTSSANPNEPPINIIFDVHNEPMGIGPNYLQRREEVNWLRDIALFYGAKLSLQSNGEYMEFCLENGHQNDFLQYLSAGFDIGTHTHLVTYEGPHNWIDHYGEPLTFDLVNQIIGDAEMFVDSVIGAENNYSLCTMTGKAYIDTMMQIHQFDFVTGPGEEGYFYFGHQAWNPFRPATWENSGACEEDLTTQFITIPHLPQINEPDNTHGMYLLLPQMKRRFLMIYIEWLSRVRNNANDKIWVWGFNTHPCMNFQHRGAIEEMLDWLNESFINHTIVAGDTIAVYASSSEIYQQYLDWEAVNPGVSSFNYVEGDPYPYTYEAMPVLLDSAGYDTFVYLGDNLNVHKMIKREQPIYAVWTNFGTETIDFSSQISGELLTTDGHGNQTFQSSTSLFVTEEPLFVESSTTSIEDTGEIPACVRLNQNSPNPFGSNTTISFTTVESIAGTELVIYNISGRIVKTLVNSVLPAGEHSVSWDGTDENGHPVGSGIYFCHLISGNNPSESRRMVLVK
ncbi:MAG: T9SS type A sorting domain-containing protein [Candidatus Aegiribacteria sp.]|nr:T9SS type A sorting domain-containing protein [Candidatus Aegiribacteria sp.]